MRLQRVVAKFRASPPSAAVAGEFTTADDGFPLHFIQAKTNELSLGPFASDFACSPSYGSREAKFLKTLGESQF
jgi:hypothetical protein